jgi:DHA2 family multidrug resistance protein-like MFS transporter
MLLYALSEAADATFTSARVVGWGAVGLAGLAVFVLLELRRSPPLLDLRLFNQKLFSLGNIMLATSFAANAGLLFVLTLFLQKLQGRSPMEAGLIQAPSAIGSAVALVFAGFCYTRIGPRRLLVSGYFLGALVCLPLVLLDQSTSALPIALLLLLRGVTGPLAGVANQTIIFGPVDNSKQGPAASITSTARQASASFGVALFATVQLTRYRAHLGASGAQPVQQLVQHAQVLAYRETFLLSTVLLVIAGGLALLVNDRQARALMRHRTKSVSDGDAASGPEPIPAD